MIADGWTRLTVRRTRSTALGLRNRPRRACEGAGEQLLTLRQRQTAQDPRRKYLRAVSRLTALAREAQAS